MTIRRWMFGAALATALSAACAVEASPIVFTGSGVSPGGAALAATATFDLLSGGELQVVLENTSLSDVLRKNEILTAIFFDGAGALTPLSASLGLDSEVWFGPSGSGNLGGEWAYDTGAGPGPTTRGIGSAGLGYFEVANFGGPELKGPKSGKVAGLQYGLTSAGDDPTTGAPAVNGTSKPRQALIHDSVVFLLAPSAGFTLDSVANVIFQFGANRRGPQLEGVRDPALESLLAFEAEGEPPLQEILPDAPEVPEPGTLSLLGAGLIYTARRLRRRPQEGLDRSRATR